MKALATISLLAATTVLADAQEPVTTLSDADIQKARTERASALEALAKKVQDVEALRGATYAMTIDASGLTQEAKKLLEVDRDVLKDVARYLDRIHADAAVSVAATAVGTIQVKKEQVTSIWADDNIRNGWDKLRSTVDVLAPLSLAASAFLVQQDQKEWAAGIGISGGALWGLSALASSFWGEKNGKKVSRALVQFEVSRNAYDDLAVQQALFADYQAKALASVGGVKKLRTECDALVAEIDARLKGGSTSADELRERVKKLLTDALAAMSTEKASSISFMEDYASSVIKRAEHYATEYPLLKQQLDGLVTTAKLQMTTFRTAAVEGYLDELPRLREQVRSFLVARQAL